MIKDLCQKIKEARKEAGYTVEDVVKKTKLHPSVIKDIENCQLGNITPIYIKGFIKIYASFLGVEIKDELNQIETGFTPKGKNKKTRPQKKKFYFSASKLFQFLAKKFSKISIQTRKKLFIILIALIIFWLGFLGFRFFFRTALSYFRSRSQKREEQVIAEPEPLISAGNIQIDRIRASLTARRPTYLRAFLDGAIIFEGVLEQGGVKTWEAEEELSLEIRDGSAVYLEVDGEPIPRLSSLRRRKKVIINSSGISIE